MLPCYSLFLEVEVPDPALNYFIVSQHELDNTEKLLAPPPFGTPTMVEGFSTKQKFEGYEVKEERIDVFPVEIVEAWEWSYDVSAYPPPPAGSSYVSWGEEMGCPPNGTIRPEGEIIDAYHIHYKDSGQDVVWDKQTGKWLFTLLYISDHLATDVGTTIGALVGSGLPDYSKQYNLTFQPDTWVEITFAVAYRPDIEGTSITQYNIPQEYSCNYQVPFPEAIQPNCDGSGLNTFVLNESCLDGDIDLLEGWGAARPNYKWVDVITDTTDIEIQRGFDMKQGIVGTPIAGVMEANILDPYLEGIETSKIAVGQRVRLRAGYDIVFSGVASSVRSEYDAVNVPTLRIEAVDALGLLNAQMVDARPQELYNTRLAEAASKVELNIQQQESTTELNPTEDAMSALELLVETQDSEGSVVWLDRFGTLYSTNRYWLDTINNLPVFRNSNFDKPPRFTFTNNPREEEEQIGIGGNTTEQVCLSSYKQVADTSQVINGITFYNFVEEEEQGTDENGNPITEKVIVRDTYTFESANSRRLYGDAGVKLTTYLPPTDLVGYADYVFANYDTPKTKVETIQFPLDKWKSLDVPEMVSIDIGDPVKVRIDDPFTQHTLNRATQRVAQIRHRITPEEWLCELDLL